MLIDHTNPSNPLPLSLHAPFPTSPPPPTSSLLTDIFSDSPPHSPSHRSPSHSPSHDTHDNTHSYSNEHPSDIPRLRASHVTAGYRTGIAASKTAALQGGFDEGYSLGAVMGLKVGWVLGVLEGIVGALRGKRQGGKEGDDVKEKQEGREWLKEIEGLLKQAREELDLRRVFGREWWDEDGVWAYGVSPTEDGGEVVFEEVADQHPLIQIWKGKVEGLIESWGIRGDVWAGEEWEKGRIREDEDMTNLNHSKPTNHHEEPVRFDNGDHTPAPPLKPSTKAIDF